MIVISFFSGGYKMRKSLIICAVLAVSLSICACPARAAISYGTSSPDLYPVFGTLIDFDDQAAGTEVLADDYAAQGVTSITELTGGTLSRYPGSQSPPYYIGTGSGWDIWGQVSGWDSIIQIDLACPASQIGLGIADSTGELDEILSVYDSKGKLLEDQVLAPGNNLYAVITRDAYDISCIRIAGDYFAVDDLQFNGALCVEKELDLAVGPAGTALDTESLPMHTDIEFTLTITVTNYADEPITGIVVKDHFGADLEIDGIVSYSQGQAPAITTSRAKKSPQQRIEWLAGDLAAGASATFIVKVSTDINPGNSSTKNPKPGKQEYTSPGRHILNSGASATGMLGQMKVSDTSDPVVVNVVKDN
jgi:hypothetical protein